MKKIFIYLLLAYSLYGCKSKSKYPLIVTSVVFGIDINDIPTNKADTIAIEYFNPKGILTKKTTINKTKTGIIEETFLYDSSGKLISSISNYSNQHIFKADSRRDNSGNIIEMKSYELNVNSDTTTHIYTYRYSEDSAVIYSKVIDKADSSIISFYEEVFDSNKHLLQSTLRIPNEIGTTTISIDKYIYDKKGNKTAEIKHNFKNNTIRKILYYYDESNNLLRESFFKDDILTYELVYKYDGERRKEAIKTSRFNEKGYKILFFYS